MTLGSVTKIGTSYWALEKAEMSPFTSMLGEENLENLASNVVDFNVTLVIISDLDTTKKTSMITLYKPDPIPEALMWKKLAG